ncbi:MAG: inorganic diphosphatase [Saprospiraceae bacterium]|nr:inorganic diphosphatase [Bacteroidia bacterium]NNE13361.1 inorganic diphosphatase [Saprospiraceae bacterium]
MLCGISCSTNKSANKTHLLSKDHRNLLKDIKAVTDDGDVNAIIEIPLGTNDKWEFNKSTGKIEWEIVNDKPRIVNYLGYPGNYGFIPQTLLSKNSGGDGDPLDILVLGPSVDRGEIIKCKIIGVLKLIDRGEQDDKLIAVSDASPMYDINSIKELNTNYKGVCDIIEIWFKNYKGSNKMESLGFGERKEALSILNKAIIEFKNKR